MFNKILLISGCLLYATILNAQGLGATPDYVKLLTQDWKGERTKDGRPKVADQLLDRLQNCTLEQIWGFLNRRGYHNQVANEWIILKPSEKMIGRVVTAQFVPSRPDLDSIVKMQGKKEGRSSKGSTNIWPIDVLTKGDVYVADGFGKINNGTLIGSSLGNAVYGRTGKGVIFYGAVRDMQELKETQGFNAWIKGHHPSYIKDMTPLSINTPIRIDQVTVFPGDVVFANEYGVVFIPAYLLEELVTSSEMIALRDEFERYLLQMAKYPSGEIHGTWNENIKNEFRTWISKYPKKLAITSKDVDEYLKKSD